MAEQLGIGMPPELDVGPGYTFRVTALDANGAVVPNINVQTVVITATPADIAGGGGGNEPGSWFLVPGSGA